MTDEGMLERIATRRAELDLLEEELVKQLVDVRVERDELVAGPVVQRISEQGFGEYLSLALPAPEVQVGGRSVLLIPARAAGIDPAVLLQDYQRLVAIVREAAGHDPGRRRGARPAGRGAGQAGAAAGEAEPAGRPFP
jgi:hypothetical protein